jgi:DNA modification methylase
MLRLGKISKNKYTTDIEDVRHVLDNIDWNFTSKSVIHEGVRPFDCRKHHWFPATFIPEIPFTLIEILTHPYATVYDPFAGIGTTYFQALLLNRRPFATEICKVAVEFMKSLLILFNPRLDFESIQRKVEKIIHEFEPRANYVDKAKDDPSISILIDKLRPWYHKNTFNQLAYLFLSEHYCDDTPTKAAMHISISAILKKVCSQDRGWGCVADNVLPKQDQIVEKNTIAIFNKHLKRLLKDLPEHLKDVTEEYNQLYDDISKEETIFHTDVRKNNVIPDNSVDLVVTSPSYPNMTDYVKSQRLSYYWLGVPLSGENRDLTSEIGARNKRHYKDALERYLKDMQEFNKILSRKVKEGGYVCFIIAAFGRNDVRRKRIIEKVILDLENYFAKEKEFIRTIPAVRRAHNLKWATLDQEKIFIFRK